ncbi:hypothetical protein HK100_009260 [Physocladia obscura]|uniref:Uncharacterized protein n=1 Tax=Physocladia obscura TaxID=109957 RepID=A0AAD5SNG3_9FUNG|nr:hypothetical protein HK100_009260 [Physocladia obscura]
MIGRPPVPNMYPGIDPSIWFKDDIARSAELVMMRNRIEGWKGTESYFRYLQKHNENLQKTYIPATCPLRAMLDQIYKSQPQIPTPLLVQMMLLIQDTLLLAPNGAQTELLAILRSRGVQVFAAGMMHERWEIRHACTRILWRLDWHPIGTAYIQMLNPFYRLCYARESHLLLSLPDDDPIIFQVEQEPSSATTASARPTPPDRRKSNRQSARPSAARMSILLEERNSNRVVFNNTKKGYMRGSVLSQTSVQLSSAVRMSTIRSGTGRTPGWFQEASSQQPPSPSSQTTSMSSAASPRIFGGSIKSSGIADMSDLDNMMRNFSQTGFKSSSLLQTQPQQRLGTSGLNNVTGASDDEDDELDPFGQGLPSDTSAFSGGPRGNPFVNQPSGENYGLGPSRNIVDNGTQQLPQQQQQQFATNGVNGINSSVGPIAPTRQPRLASTAIPGQSVGNLINQQQQYQPNLLQQQQQQYPAQQQQQGQPGQYIRNPRNPNAASR